jgi:hypothetical protein
MWCECGAELFPEDVVPICFLQMWWMCGADLFPADVVDVWCRVVSLKCGVCVVSYSFGWISMENLGIIHDVG